MDDLELSGSPKSTQFWRIARGNTDEIGRTAMQYANALRRRQAMRHKRMLMHAQMYADGPMLGLGPYEYMMFDERGETLRMNVTKAVVDSFVTQIVQANPKPMVLTSGADWSIRRKSKGMTKWWEAKAQEADWRHTVSNPCVRDEAVFGTAFVKVGIENESDAERADVFSERVLPFEFLTDDTECQNPAWMRACAHQKWYDRYQLSHLFPGKKSDISDSRRYGEGMEEQQSWSPEQMSTSDLVLVTELWHLASTPTSDDGMRVLVLPSGKLLAPVQRWKEERFPIFPIWRSHPSMGLWGQSIPWELRGMQMQINETLEDLQEALRTLGRPKWMVPFGSEVMDDVVDDEIGTIMRYAGTQPPTVYAPSVIPPEQFKFLWDLWAKAFEMIGDSTQSAQGQIPPGLSGSGASIRAWSDVKGGRMYEASEGFENGHIEWGKRAFECAKRVAEIRPDYASKFRNKKKAMVEVVKFKDVVVDDYDVGIYPASRFSSYPGQRMAQVDALFERGVVQDKDEYRELLDFPDLQKEGDLAGAPRRIADKLIERYLDAEDPDEEGLYVSPDPIWDMQYMRKRFLLAAAEAFLDEAPDGNIALLTRTANACQYWIEQANKPIEPPPGADMPPPDAGMPMPPPGPPGGPPPIGAPA